jgi:hypothetical protein
MATKKFVLKHPWSDQDFQGVAERFLQDPPPPLAFKVLLVARNHVPACWYVATSLEDLKCQAGIDTVLHDIAFGHVVRTLDGWDLSLESRHRLFNTWDDLVRGPADDDDSECWDIKTNIIGWVVPKIWLYPEHYDGYPVQIFSERDRPWAYPFLLPVFPAKMRKNQTILHTTRLEYLRKHFLSRDVAAAVSVQTSNREPVSLRIDSREREMKIESRCTPCEEDRASTYAEYHRRKRWIPPPQMLLPQLVKSGHAFQPPWSFSTMENDEISGFLAGCVAVLDVQHALADPWGTVTFYGQKRSFASWLKMRSVLTDATDTTFKEYIDMDERRRYFRLNYRADPHHERLQRRIAEHAVVLQRHGTVREPSGEDDPDRRFALGMIRDRSNLRLKEYQIPSFLDMRRREQGAKPTLDRLLFRPTGVYDDSGEVELVYSPILYYQMATRKRALEHDVRHHVRGGILVAPCGWGKTFAALALVGVGVQESCQSTLVVCPKNLVAQWEKACGDLVPSATCISWERKKKSRASFPQELPSGSHVVIMSYNGMRKVFVPGSADDPSTLASHDWDRVIFDESHQIVNLEVVAAARKVRSKIRWGLTATLLPDKPTEKDLDALGMQFAAVTGLSNSLIYKQSFVESFLMQHFCVFPGAQSLAPVSWELVERNVDVVSSEATQQRFDQMTEALSRRGWSVETSALAQKLLRKISAGLAGLAIPKARSESEPGCSKRSLTAIYEDAEDEAGTCAICMDSFDEPVSTYCGHVFCQLCILSALNHKKQCPQCRKPCTSVVSLQEARELVEENKAAASPFTEAIATARVHLADGFRIEKAVQLLDSFDDGDKVVVFSQYDLVLKAVATRMEGARLFKNSDSVQRQKAILEDFETDPAFRVLVMNVRLCNAGLNLTSASKIIFMESLASDVMRTQAVGRCARTGQTKDVFEVLTLIDTATKY